MTIWYTPFNVTQHAEYPDKNIQWQRGANNFDLNVGTHPIQTIREILYISNDGHAPLREKTYFLHFTDFRIEDAPATITGIELRTTIRRKGRILDETVMLRYDDMVIGENKINYRLDEFNHVPVNNLSNYGGSTDKWGTTLTKAQIESVSFGVTLRLQSHLFYPHRETAIVDKVEIRVY